MANKFRFYLWNVFFLFIINIQKCMCVSTKKFWINYTLKEYDNDKSLKETYHLTFNTTTFLINGYKDYLNKMYDYNNT